MEKQFPFLNQNEVGACIIVASLAVMFFSGLTVLKIKSYHERMQSIDSEIDTTKTELMTEEFNRSVRVLEEIKTSSIGYKISNISSSLRDSAGAVERVASMAEDFEKTYEYYQWVFLYSLLGIVAGAAVIVI